MEDNLLTYELSYAHPNVDMSAERNGFNKLGNLYLALRGEVFDSDPFMQPEEADITLALNGDLESCMWQLYKPNDETIAKVEMYFAPHDGRLRIDGFSPENLNRMRIRVHNPTQDIKEGIERLISSYSGESKLIS
ncbi:MAG TPA: hypothetical protein HA282_04590 [Nanoarchaeota archaeon]|nr:hypothetical protein [Candidatus Pacearchaeota archaeon]HIH17751.1 hypothetical protein [Nanoarchaeota archaeon]HIH33776.1 hypothetical protein [Nanoarchaeota archaeon]HIH50812.1 hypothetical protein [Nanoarchaeota archaeon]HIH66462.1 hypothetical protein [Nanoarchaeota archaeon]